MATKRNLNNAYSAEVLAKTVLDVTVWFGSFGSSGQTNRYSLRRYNNPLFRAIGVQQGDFSSGGCPVQRSTGRSVFNSTNASRPCSPKKEQMGSHAGRCQSYEFFVQFGSGRDNECERS